MEMLINGGASSNGAAREAAAFRDAEGAAQWLAGQPQANPSAMMSSLTGQLESFSRLNVSPRQRFKVLEILRKAVFAATAASQTRSAGKPLPLAADEQRALDAVRHLWRAFATAYQRCLQACLDGDSSLDGHAARVAHRVAACLHMEQVAGYASGAAPLAGFWHCLHTAFLTAEKLECGDEPVADRWPGDVSGTTFNGQYAMSLMLYLAQPFSMSGVQRTSVERWLARWRELAGVTAQAPADAESVSWRIDLGQDLPLCEDGESGEINLSRWLRLDAVLGKIRVVAPHFRPESRRKTSSLAAISPRMPVSSCWQHWAATCGKCRQISRLGAPRCRSCRSRLAWRASTACWEGLASTWRQTHRRPWMTTWPANNWPCSDGCCPSVGHRRQSIWSVGVWRNGTGGTRCCCASRATGILV